MSNEDEEFLIGEDARRPYEDNFDSPEIKKLQPVKKANEDDEFLKMAEECGVDCFKRPLKSEIIALCKKVQDKQKEKDALICEALVERRLDSGEESVGVYDAAEAIRKGE
jgi:hypothetical protein